MANKRNVLKKVADITGIVIASVLIIFAFCGRFCNTDGAQGFMHFANFFVGSFGMAFYGMMAAVIVACSLSLAGKTIKIPVKYAVYFALMFFAVILIVHMLTTTYLPKDFDSHMSLIYHYYDNQMGIPTFGGVVFGLFAWCLTRALSIYGACIVIALLLGWTVYEAGDFFYKYFTGKLSLVKESSPPDIEPSFTAPETEVKTDENYLRKLAFQTLFEDGERSASPQQVVSQQEPGVFGVAAQSSTNQPFNRYGENEAAKFLFNHEDSKKDGADSFFGKTKQEQPENDYLLKGYYKNNEPQEESKTTESSTEWKISHVPNSQSITEQQKSVPTSKDLYSVEPVPVVPQQQERPSASATPQTTLNDFERAQSEKTIKITDEPDITDILIDYPLKDEPEIIKETEQPKSQNVYAPFAEQPTVQSVEQPKREAAVPQQTQSVENKLTEKETPDEVTLVDRGYESTPYDTQIKIPIPQEEPKTQEGAVHEYMEYNVPPLHLLNEAVIVEDNDDGERQRLAQAIVNKLSVFNIKIELADIIVGPTVTRYMFTVLSQKTRMSDFKQYSDDIKACVEAQEDILIEAPVKGTNMVGIEVANKSKRPVVLRELLESPAFVNAKGDLVFAIGQEVSGKVVIADLADMPHLLVAGTTGSGKSVCLNCLIVSMMYKYGPEYLRFVMVDPKFVELSRYNGIPHMLTAETITTMQDALACMDYLIAEMESRYQLFRQSGVDKISEYNKRVNPKTTQKLPYLVFIVDELADLMATNKSAFEAKLMRLAQKARAAGIHIVLATQRPDVKVITGTIKGNLPSRMALKVSSVYDSQTIIGGGGAEKLLGKGDMLFMNSSGSSDLTRVQCAYVSNDEIRALVKYSAETNEVYYDTSITDKIFVTQAQEEAKRREEEAERNGGGDEGRDELYPFYKKALRYWLERNGGKASISSIQRGINVGFNRAGRIMENLQRMGYVEELSASESNRAVKVLVTLEELDDLFPDEDEG